MGTVNSRRRLGRQLRRVNLRALRLVRRHNFSLISAAVLGGALFLALTSSSFELKGDTASAVVTASPIASSAPPTTSISIAPALPTQPPASRLLVYYVIANEAKKNELEMAVQSHAMTQSPRSALPPLTFRYYLVVRNSQEEAEAVTLLNELAILAPTEGYRLRIVDMR